MVRKLYARLVLRLIEPALREHAAASRIAVKCGIGHTCDVEPLLAELQQVSRNLAEPIPRLFAGTDERGSWSLDAAGRFSYRADASVPSESGISPEPMSRDSEATLPEASFWRGPPSVFD